MKMTSKKSLMVIKIIFFLLYFNTFQVNAQQNDVLYVSILMTASGGAGTKLARIVVEPFKIKKDFSTQNFLSLFLEHVGVNKVHPGYNINNTFTRTVLIDENKNYVEKKASGWLETTEYHHVYSIIWQPPMKYTGIQPSQATPKVQQVQGPVRTTNNVANSGGSITVEKKDTKFEEAEAKRILDAKKAEVQRQVKLQALKNQATPQQKEWIKKVLVGSSRQ